MEKVRHILKDEDDYLFRRVIELIKSGLPINTVCSRCLLSRGQVQYAIRRAKDSGTLVRGDVKRGYYPATPGQGRIKRSARNAGVDESSESGQ